MQSVVTVGFLARTGVVGVTVVAKTAGWHSLQNKSRTRFLTHKRVEYSIRSTVLAAAITQNYFMTSETVNNANLALVLALVHPQPPLLHKADEVPCCLPVTSRQITSITSLI